MPDGGGTVAGLLRRVQLAALAGVGLLGLLGLLGALLALRATDELGDELLPVLTAQEAVLQDLTDAETGVRAYSLTGLRNTLEPYFQGLAELPAHERTVRAHARDDEDLAALVAEQEAAAEAWLAEYATPKVAGPGGSAAFDPGLFAAGKARFDALREVHARTTAALEADVDAVQDRTRQRLLLLVAASAAVLLAMLAAAVAAPRRLGREVVAPLSALEETVHRLTAAEPGARAPVSGRREVRAVAVSLNALAEAQERARAVEEHVRAELRRLDAARTDFVSNVSHELRTPLTTIHGYLELVEEEFDGRMAPRHERMLVAGRRNVERLRGLIDDILTLSRAEGSSTTLERLPLRDLVDDCVTDLRTTAAGRGVTIDLEADRGDPLPVLADRGQLSRALLNVLSNAVKFSPDGGRVEVSAGRDGEELVVRVVDHGIGIPAAELDHLGTRFFRASNAVEQSVPGTGLGLRIVQTILGHHGGTLQLASVEGAGTTVTVRLPAQARDEGGTGEGGAEGGEDGPASVGIP